MYWGPVLGVLWNRLRTSALVGSLCTLWTLIWFVTHQSPSEYTSVHQRTFTARWSLQKLIEKFYSTRGFTEIVCVLIWSVSLCCWSLISVPSFFDVEALLLQSHSSPANLRWSETSQIDFKFRFTISFYLWPVLAMYPQKAHDLCDGQFWSRPRDILRLCFHCPQWWRRLLSSVHCPRCSPSTWVCGWCSSLSGPRWAWKGQWRCSPAKIT